MPDPASYTSALRKNPFSPVAHAAALGKEVLELTVRTTGFQQLLEVVFRRGAQDEPLAMVVLGAAGSGKTHFLKFLEQTYRPSTETWRDEGELSGDRDEPQFHRVIFVPNPGASFAELVRRVVRSTLDPETLRRLVDRLLAFPARELCLEKARRGEEVEANQRLAELLRKNPKEIDNYWTRFSKSEIYNAALSTLDQISRHPVFRDSLAELLRARRDGAAVDYEHVVRTLVEQWSGGGEDAASQAASKRDFEAVQIAESVLALLDLLAIRVLLMIDECQVVLRGENLTSENVLFRQLVNATPRGSVMAFALRTEDWLRFADDASERRVRFQKLTVSSEEGWEIILRYLIVKGGNPHLTIENARRLFPLEAASLLWSETGGIVGRILALCYEVHERLTAGPADRSVTDVACEVAEETRGAGIARPKFQEVARSVEDIVRQTCESLGRRVRQWSHGFDFEVQDEEAARPAVLVGLRQANDDVEEAGKAHELGRAVLEVRETSPRTRILVVVTGYRSPEITQLLSFLVEQLVVFDQRQGDSGEALEEALRALILEPERSSTRLYSRQEGLQWVDELAAIKRRRVAENARISRIELRGESKPRWGWSGLSAAALAIAVSVGGLLFWFQQSKKNEAQRRYQAVMSDFLSGQPAKMAVALGEIDKILPDSPKNLEPTRSTLATYLRFADEQSVQIRQEVVMFLLRLPKPPDRPPDLHGARLYGLNLRDINLRGYNLANASLASAHLEGADLRQANLQGADLRRVELLRAKLQEADLRGSDLRWADLEGADLRGVDLKGLDLSGADFRGARVDSLAGACGDENTTLDFRMPKLPDCSRSPVAR